MLITKPKTNLPAFSHIDLNQVESELTRRLENNRRVIDRLLQSSERFTWESLIQPLEEINDELNNFWGPIAHLHAVVSSPKLREVYHACLPKLADYHTEISHNRVLYEAVRFLAEQSESQKLNPVQYKVIDNYLRDFKLGGVSLPAEKKKRFAELSKTLSQLTTTFEEHLLDATQAWSKHITDERLLSGIPPHAIALAQQTAVNQKKEGWIFRAGCSDRSSTAWGIILP